MDRTRRPAIDRLRASGAALGLAIACLALTCSAWAATPVGLWYAEGGAAQVAIEPCGETLCGRVVWLRSPLDEDGCELFALRPTISPAKIDCFFKVWLRLVW